MSSKPSVRRVWRSPQQVAGRIFVFCSFSAAVFLYATISWYNLKTIVTLDLENHPSSIVRTTNCKNLTFSTVNGTSESIAKTRLKKQKPRHTSNDIKKKLKNLCPMYSPLLVGWSDNALPEIVNGKENEDIFISKMVDAGVTAGGKYMPTDCQARNKVAIIVPYRNRKNHLKIFLRYMHPFLQRQQLEYVIVVVEQSEGSPFNRGMLMNIGFQETQLKEPYQCFIFHDVDLLPENDRNPYTCPEDGRPRQMAFSIDIYNYRFTAKNHFGGVNAFSTSDFQQINGFSNLYWGWGSEDDDLYLRALNHNLTITRAFDKQPSRVTFARYKMLDHDWVNPNPNREFVFKDGPSRYQYDGLLNLNYQMLDVDYKILFTHIYVNIQN